MSLSNLIFECGGDNVCYVAAPSIADKGQILAVAFVEKGKLATAVKLSELESGTKNADALITAVRTAQLRGEGVYFPVSSIKGSKAKPEEVMENEVWGRRTAELPTGDVTNTVELGYKYAYSTAAVRLFNAFRKNTIPFDMVYWTDKNAVLVEEDVTFFDVGTEIEGDYGTDITGGLSVRWDSEGEPLPFAYKDKSALNGFTQLLISPPNTNGSNSDTVESVACAGKCDRYELGYNATGFNGTFGFEVSEDLGVESCVTWKLIKDCGDGEIEAEMVLDENTGVITFTDYNEESINKYTIIAENAGCVTGQYCFELIVKSLV